MNNDNNIKVFVSVIIILILGVVATVLMQSKNAGVADAPGKYDALAQCITDSGATFYGAFWCPHCQAQKKLFGGSAHLLPYVECSNPDGQSQNQLCNDKKIVGYPTWELKDGTRIPDENGAGVTLETLATKTGCTLPQ